MAKITIKDIAEKCSVSISTVSRAINNQSDISEKTREKILNTIKELNYIPNVNARKLKIKNSNAIGVLIKGLSNPFFLPMFSIIEKKINSNGYKFFFHKIEENENEIEAAIKLESQENLKGIIFLGGFYLQDEEKLQKLSVPFVISTILNKDIPLEHCASIGLDDYQESMKIIDYLISLGHKKIAFIGARKDDKSIGMMRLNGYIDALKKHDLEVNKNLIITTEKKENPYTFEYGYKKMSDLIKNKDDFTAIYLISDSMAIGAMKKLVELGYNVPEDYSIVGFDGLDINKYLTPSITTIVQPVRKIAESACDLLFELIRNNNKNKKKIIKYEGDLWIGETTKKII